MCKACTALGSRVRPGMALNMAQHKFGTFLKRLQRLCTDPRFSSSAVVRVSIFFVWPREAQGWSPLLKEQWSHVISLSEWCLGPHPKS